MRRLQLLLASAASGLLYAVGVPAAGEHSAHHHAGAKPAKGAPSKTAGLVKKVDKDASKVTISHDPIENLGMPKMTMVFRVKDKVMLDQVNEGDKINFVADKVNDEFTVMQMERAK